MTPATESPDAAREPVPLTDERIDFIAETVIKGMPDGIQGFLRAWGWRQFARALLEDCAGHYREPDTITRLTAERDAARRDAERWRALAHVFHLSEIKRGSTMLSTHWAGWVSGEHTSVNDWADAYAAELRAQERGA